MLIKYIKLGDKILQNVETYIINPETGEKTKNSLIPQNLEELKNITIDTLNWLIGEEVKKIAGNTTKLSASNSKAIMLVYKLLKQNVELNTDNLTKTEKAIINEFDKITESGYTDSELLLNTIKAVGENIMKYNALIEEALKVKNTDKLIKILESL